MNLSSPKPPLAPSRLTLFALLFAWANILHQLSYPSWIMDLNLIGWLVFSVNVALAIKPSSFPIFAAALVLRLVYTAYWIPMIRGHLFLEGLFTLGVVIGLSLQLRKFGKFGSFDIDQQERLFESFAPILRITTLIVYAAVTLSKLNTEFIDPQKSAAVQLLFWTATEYSFVSTGQWAQKITIWGTLALEGGIPILLCFQRTRWLGIVIGLAFHTLLAFIPLRISSFTLTMCLLLFVWLPPESPKLIYNPFLRVCRASKLTPPKLVFLFSLLAGTTGMLYAGRNGFDMDMQALDLGMGIWWWQTTLMFIALWTVYSLPHEPTIKLVKTHSWTLRLFAAFVVFNCLCPYIGLKTRSSLSMHCNLKTEEGYWNHLFLPEQMRVFKYQDNLVKIVDSNLPDFKSISEKGMPLPYFEFRRWCRLAEDNFYVVYKHGNDNPLRFEKRDGIGSDPTLMKRIWPLEWFLCFNPAGASHDYIPGFVKRTGPPRNVVPTFVVPSE